MGLFTDGFKLLKKASEPLYKTPKSIQETIEIMAVAENGIFEVSRNKYSKCYRFQDINYTTATEDEQIGIFERYCKFLNSLDCNYKITINNKNKNMEDLRDKVLITEKNDGFNNYRRIYNDIIEEKIIEGRQGIEQERYLTITIERKNFEEAKAQFATLEATIHKAFIELGAEIVPLNGNERLKVLYDYYHLGDEGSFDFDIKKAKKVGADFKNDLCNGMVKYFPDHFEDESKYCKALFIKKYPSSLSDRFINEITSLPVHSITSIDVVPVPKDLTTKVLQKKYLGIESDIIKQQRVRNKNNDFSTEISYAKRTEKKEIEAIMDDVRENDQCLFFVGVTIILMAESKKELESVCETVETIGKRNSCTIDTHYLKQREALNTALPIGVRQVETMRTLLTQSLAVLMPFNVQELNDSTGNYYGINQISKNVNIGNRKKLINGNGFVFGVPGSGKSFFCKMEMGSVFLSGDDEIIVIDPMNEYFDIAQTYGGTVVNMSTYTDNYVNPLEMDVWSLDPNDSKGMIREKGEFMLGLCEQCIGDSLNSRQKSIIDRCVRKMYIDIARGREKYIPVMSDFYDILMEQPEDEAKDIALSLELFVNGSLNIFNHQTNVDVDNRFTVYGIRDLGTELSPITMLVMMESIQNRIVENGQKGKATWLYIDEFHVLLNSEYSAKYLQQLWKKVRKQGGLCTGITQNVVDLLQNYTATTMLANSEFVALLKQANTDSSKMAAAGTAVAPGAGTAVGMAAGYATGVSIEAKDVKAANRSRKIKFFLDKMKEQENQTDSVVKLVKDLIVKKAVLWIKAAAPIIGLVLLLLVLLVVIVAVPVIAVIAILYNSPFALFLPPLESGDTVQTVTSAYVSEFNRDVNTKVNEHTGYDFGELVYVDYEGMDENPSNYYDIMAVYMVKYGVGDTATIMNDISKGWLQTVVNDMCSYTTSSGTKDVEETDADGNVTTVTKSVLYVNVTLKSYRDMISVYGFNSDQVEMLEQIMSPEFMGQLGYAGSGSGGGGGSPGVSSMTEDEINAILSGITDSRQKAVCSYALHRVGYPYSQELRDSGNYYDCSSLAYYSWKDAGVNISHGGATTAAAEAQGLDEAGKTVSYDEMQPGDLIFYSFTNNGRYKNISHVAVYVGNGKVVEALNERVGVVYRDVASVGKIVVIGRP